MTETLGQKIKKLRKELKMTQSDLAGNEMTKSMLSHIENNQASPSMKNLQYIAKRLEKSISYFLEEDFKEKKEIITEIPIEELNTEMRNINNLIENKQFKKALEELKPILKSYNFNKTTIIYADVISKLGTCLIELGEFEEGEKTLRTASKVYIDNHLFIKAAKTYNELNIIYFKTFDYDKSLKILEETWNIYHKSINKDIFFEIDLLHFQSYIYTSLDNYKEALSSLEKAMNLSNEKNSYYKLGEIYRVISAVYWVLKDNDKFQYNIKKAKEFADFSEDKSTLSRIEHTLAVYANSLGNPNKALEHINMFLEYTSEDVSLIYLELAKAYYTLKKYDLALENIVKAAYSSEVFIKPDYLYMWEAKVHEGLILHALGKSEKAIESIQYAIDKMIKFSYSSNLSFAYKSLSTVYSEINDFENAFYALKKSEEILSLLNNK
ncbi:helix-turn-helix domain-containing protein [Oceanirhabdus seepicola]|uniref:Helix-turn-helix domain-containing protein n=1 Tax=Oceanirhabdus seepicola TaxID=2828781 RepID=A0A9J6NZQ6_9CLOT|nr:helix-turn-helix domain-containing protein [Oceanirhabdus seepicola]MCM1988640.1 helix-turn-helix domain-containing protein [Oceanirhabdus seepicola]